jgi:hypothetical protein
VIRRDQPSPASIFYAQKLNWHDLMIKRVVLFGQLANHLQQITHQDASTS